ncbi:MAG: hypothetical protein MUC60_06480 [Oscillatoria sp. Prado101]|nr:hypothetical protein [Oscillatoria sp. Prado101]
MGGAFAAGATHPANTGRGFNKRLSGAGLALVALARRAAPSIYGRWRFDKPVLNPDRRQLGQSKDRRDATGRSADKTCRVRSRTVGQTRCRSGGAQHRQPLVRHRASKTCGVSRPNQFGNWYNQQ